MTAAFGKYKIYPVMYMETTVIRPWRPEDAPALAEALNNRKVLANLRDGLPFPYTERDALGYISAMLAAEPGEVFAFAIDCGGRAAGSISVTRCGNIHRRTAEIGYYLGEAYWGRGLATRAVSEACEYVFSNSDILRIFAEPFERNTASRRVLEKSSFTLEGILRANAIKDGQVLNMCMYSRLSPELEGGYGAGQGR